MILKTLSEFQTAVPTAAGTEDFSDFEPYIRSAELWIKSNVLGKTLYDAIIDSSSASTEPDEDLIRLCQNVIGNHAYWDAIPFLDVVHTESGFAIITAQNKVPASKERVERLREQCLIRRDNEVEYLIAYLEENSQYHTAWKSSAAYSILSDCLISTAAELKQFSQWDGTRKDFMLLRPKMNQETMTKLEPVFSKDYIEELIEKQRSQELSGDDLKIMNLLKQVLGCLLSDNQHAAEKIMEDALWYIDRYPESFSTYIDSLEYKARATEGYINSLDGTIFSSLFQ